MNIKLTQNDLNYIVMYYLINISEDMDTLSEDGNVVYNKEFDKFLKILDKKSLGGLKSSYGRLPPDVKLKYKLFMTAIKRMKEDNKDMRIIS